LENLPDMFRSDISNFILKRRMMLLRCEESVLSSHMRSFEGRYVSLKGISKWVLDLSFLNNFSSVFSRGVEVVEDMPIAGISVLDDIGDVLYSARSVSEVLDVFYKKGDIRSDIDLNMGNSCLRKNRL
ncbi:MAG: hypothetical protein ACK4TN_06240, partial [Brevinematales bacterium]